MQGGMHVVDGVVAVVERQEIDDRPNEIARAVVVFHFDAAVFVNLGIAAVVLEHIHRNDAPLRKEVRGPHIEQELAPVQNQEQDLRHAHDHPLFEALLVEIVSLPPRESAHLSYIGLDQQVQSGRPP